MTVRDATFRVEFSRTDAHAEGELIRTLHCDEFVQITYEEVRFGPEGEHVAFYDTKEGVWRMHPKHETGDPHEWYTDVTVSLEEVTA